MIIILLFYIVLILLLDNIVFLSLLLSLFFIYRAVNYYLKYKIISYMDIWNVAFAFMVLSEMVLSRVFFMDNMMDIIRFILISNTLINIGFLIKTNSQKVNSISLNNLNIDGFKFMLILLSLSIIYFGLRIGGSIMAFREGRVNVMTEALGSGSLSGTLIGAIGTSLPVIATYLFRYKFNFKYKLIYLLIIILCVLPQFLWGTRFVLLFSVVSPIIIMFENRKLNISSLIFAAVVSLVLVVSTNSIQDSRTINMYKVEYDNIADKIASYGSVEGVVNTTSEIVDYYEKHGLSYGKESAFLLYFWIPRKLWNAKPTQLSFWLPNHYRDVSEKFSGAYGYWGELMMDFGYWSLIFYLPFGIFLRWLESKKIQHISKNTYTSILYYTLIPVFFFSVRSPQTIIISFFGFYMIYVIIGFYVKKNYFEEKINY